jgi:succinyl-diaminopimelate desuccinylase
MLAELVAMPTVTHETATCRAAVDWIRYQLEGLPLHFHQHTREGHTALVATTRDTRRPALMLHAHVDVSPAAPGDFKLTVRDGKYFGRGVFDMKYAIAVYLHLLRELGPNLSQYDLGVTFTSDEEVTGGAAGAGELADAGWGGKVIINPDAIPGWNIQQASKGLIRYRVDSVGKPGHGSRPWLYRNAIRQLMDFIDDLSSHFPAEPCGHQEHPHATLNIGLIQGGAAANQVAADAFAELDIRFMPDRRMDDIEALVSGVAARHEHITARALSGGEPVMVNIEARPVRAIAELIRTVSGTEPGYVLAHGGSESGYYTAHQLPVLMFGPEGGGHHSAREWVSIKGIADFYEIIRRYTEQTARLA